MADGIAELVPQEDPAGQALASGPGAPLIPQDPEQSRTTVMALVQRLAQHRLAKKLFHMALDESDTDSDYSTESWWSFDEDEENYGCFECGNCPCAKARFGGCVCGGGGCHHRECRAESSKRHRSSGKKREEGKEERREKGKGKGLHYEDEDRQQRCNKGKERARVDDEQPSLEDLIYRLAKRERLRSDEEKRVEDWMDVLEKMNGQSKEQTRAVRERRRDRDRDMDRDKDRETERSQQRGRSREKRADTLKTALPESKGGDSVYDREEAWAEPSGRHGWQGDRKHSRAEMSGGRSPGEGLSSRAGEYFVRRAARRNRERGLDRGNGSEVVRRWRDDRGSR